MRVFGVSFQRQNSARALYLQVRDYLAQQIALGTFRPGAVLPNELQFAEQLGVSLGTLRKSLETLEKERLITRRQGRGTFVRNHAEGTQLFLDNIRTKDGQRVPFTVAVLDMVEAPASAEEQRRLALHGPERIARCRQVRSYNGPFMFEEIALPAPRFPGLAGKALKRPFQIAALAQEHGVFLGEASECIEITTVTPQIGVLLRLEPGTPLLKLDRVHFSLDRVPLEWRVGYCELTSIKYVTKLGIEATHAV